MLSPLRRILILSLILTIGAGCSGGKGPGDCGSANPNSSNNTASINKSDYPVFPEPDAGADPSVSAEQGGKGFKGEGWETYADFDLIGDPRAVKGGVFRDPILDFPGTLRMVGPEANT